MDQYIAKATCWLHLSVVDDGESVYNVQQVLSS